MRIFEHRLSSFVFLLFFSSIENVFPCFFFLLFVILPSTWTLYRLINLVKNVIHLRISNIHAIFIIALHLKRLFSGLQKLFWFYTDFTQRRKLSWEKNNERKNQVIFVFKKLCYMSQSKKHCCKQKEQGNFPTKLSTHEDPTRFSLFLFTSCNILNWLKLFLL